MTVSRVQGGRASGAVRSQAEPGNEKKNEQTLAEPEY